MKRLSLICSSVCTQLVAEPMHRSLSLLVLRIACTSETTIIEWNNSHVMSTSKNIIFTLNLISENTCYYSYVIKNVLIPVTQSIRFISCQIRCNKLSNSTNSLFDNFSSHEMFYLVWSQHKFKFFVMERIQLSMSLDVIEK